jgi:hypothetical protein
MPQPRAQRQRLRDASRAGAPRRRPWPGAGSPAACRPASSRCWRGPAAPAPRAGRRWTAAGARRSCGAACAGARASAARPAAPAPQPRAQLVGRQPRAAPADEQRRLAGARQCARRTPSQAASACQRRRAHRHAAPLAPLPSTWAVASAVDPAGGGRRGARPAPAARRCAGRSRTAARRWQWSRARSRGSSPIAPALGAASATACSTDSAFGSGLPAFGARTPSTGLARTTPVAAPPAVQAAPGRQRDGDAARAQPPRCAAAPSSRARGAAARRAAATPSAAPRPAGAAGRRGIIAMRARRQAPLDRQVLQVSGCSSGSAAEQRGTAAGAARQTWLSRTRPQAAGSSRDSAAPAISPMRIRNSVPMSAL